MQEYLVDIRTDGGIRSEQTEIRVLLRCPQVVVAGAEMRVLDELHPSPRVVLPPREQGELGMRLEAEHTVDDLGTRAFQLLGPIDVRFLVEPCEQFDDHADLLTAAGCVEERLHQNRLDARPVNRLLDRNDVRVLRRAPDEIDDDLERLIRMMQQDVRRLDGGEQVGRAAQALRQTRDESSVLEPFEIDLIDKRGEAGHVHRSMAAVEVGVGERELFEKQARERRRAIVRNLEANGRRELSLPQLALDRLAEVLHLLLVDPQIRVACHAELRIAPHLPAGKELGQVRMDDRRQHDEPMLGSRDFPRHANDAPKHSRRLHDGYGGLATERVAAGQIDNEIQALACDLGERVGGVETDGRQQWPHFLVKILGDPSALRRGEVGAADQVDAGFGKRWKHGVIEQQVLLVDQCSHFIPDMLHQGLRLRQGHAVRRRSLTQLLLEGRDPHLEEFVQIACEDAEETQPLEQGYVVVSGECEHATIERELGQLAIEQERCRGIHRGQRASLPGASRTAGMQVCGLRVTVL